MARSEVSIAVVLVAFCFGACLAQSEECSGTHIIMEDETFNQIAATVRVTVSDLEAANPQVDNIDDIFVGDVLQVPCDKAAPFEELDSSLCVKDEHIVMEDDILFDIAQANGVTIQQIRDVNPNLVDIQNLYIGQKINIPC